MYKLRSSEESCDPGQVPGQDQDDHGSAHAPETGGECSHKVLQCHHRTAHVQPQGQKQREQAAHDQASGRIRVCEGIDQSGTGESTTGIGNADNAQKNQRHHRDDQIRQTAFTGMFHIFLKLIVAGSKQISLFRIFLMKFHGAVINTQKDNREQHHDRTQRIQIVRDRTQEHAESVDIVLFRNCIADCRSPAGDRCYDTDRRSSRIDQISQFRT